MFLQRLTSCHLSQGHKLLFTRSFAKTLGQDALLFKKLIEGERAVTHQAESEVPAEAVQDQAEKELTTLISQVVGDISQCRGCGAPLQSEFPHKIGYVPPERMNLESNLKEISSEDNDLSALLNYQPETEINKSAAIICQRCFHLKHYGKVYPIEISADDFLKEIKPIKNKKALIVKIIDIFDFEGSFLPQFKKYSGDNAILLVANKIDLLPAGASNERILKWINSAVGKRGIASNIIGTHLISCQTGEGIRDLAEAIEYHRNGLDVYIMGQANVGKSSFLNQLLKIFGGKTISKALTVSSLPGTTLSTIGFPIGEEGTMYDTPGVMNPHTGLPNILSPEELKFLHPKAKIKPIVLRIEPGTTFFLGGLGRIDYISGPPLLFFTVYVSSSIYIHRVKTEVADQTYRDQVGDLLRPPFSRKDRKFDSLVGRKQELFQSTSGWKQAFVDIVFHGLGWVAITGAGDINIKVWHPEKTKVTTRDPLMPFDSELGKTQKKSVLRYKPGRISTIKE